MENSFDTIQQLLQEKADYQARLNLIPYDGSPGAPIADSGSPFGLYEKSYMLPCIEEGYLCNLSAHSVKSTLCCCMPTKNQQTKKCLYCIIFVLNL